MEDNKNNKNNSSGYIGDYIYEGYYNHEEINENYNLDYDDSEYTEDDELIDNFIKYRLFKNVSPIEMLRAYKDYSDLDFKNNLRSYINESKHPYGQINTSNSISAKNAIDELKNTFKMIDWQFDVYDSNNVPIAYAVYPLNQSKMTLVIPQIKQNKKIITDFMLNAGYYVSVERIQERNGMNWVLLMFNPYKQDSVNEYIRRECDTIIHAAKPDVRDNIIKNGFEPRSENKVFKYPKRAFFNLGNPDKHYLDMMSEVSSTRVGDTIYDIYYIDLDMVPKNIEFFDDPNCQNCVYTTKSIPYNCVRKVKKIWFNPDKMYSWDWLDENKE